MATHHERGLQELTRTLSPISYKEAVSLDFKGKDAWRNRNVEAAFNFKVMAARHLERIAAESHDPTEINNPKILEEAAFSYDKAAKNAEAMGALMTSIICRIRAAKLYSKLILIEENERHIKNLDFTSNSILKLSQEYCNSYNSEQFGFKKR